MAGTLPEELGSCFPELNSFKYSFNQVNMVKAQALLLLLARQLLPIVIYCWTSPGCCKLMRHCTCAQYHGSQLCFRQYLGSQAV